MYITHKASVFYDKYGDVLNLCPQRFLFNKDQITYIVKDH